MSRNRIVENGQSTDNGTGRNRHARRQSNIMPGLLVAGGGIDQQLEPDDLLDNELIGELRSMVEAAEGVVRFTINNLLAWSDEARWELFVLVVDLEDPPEVWLSQHDDAFPNLFQAVLHALEYSSDIERSERGKRAALEAAALIHPHSLEIACSQVADRLKELGVKGILPQTLLKQSGGIVREAVNVEGNTPVQCADRFLTALRTERGLVVELPVVYYRQSFWIWDGVRWQEQNDDQFKSRVTGFLQSVSGCEEIGDRFIRDVIAHLKGRTLLDCWDKSPPLLVTNWMPLTTEPSTHLIFENGVVDTAELLSARPLTSVTVNEFSPRYFSTVVLPFEFDPSATCPLWTETLREIFPRQGSGDCRIKVLREFIGWTLIRGDLSFQKFLVLVGDGANGKSTLLRIWEAVLGRENVSHVPLNHFNGEFQLVEMNGKLANIAPDMTYVEKVDEGMLKALTGGDSVQANRKFKSPITMVPTARLVFATNVLPQINDRSDGVWRRLIAMPFLEQFTGEAADLQRVDRLLEELPGIFNWAVKGARRLYRQNGFTECEVCRRCVDEHRDYSDPFRQWVNEHVTFDEELCIPTIAAYDAYHTFCDSNGRKPTNSGEFGKRVLALPDIIKWRSGLVHGRKYFYVGLGLTTGGGTRLINQTDDGWQLSRRANSS